MRARYLGPLIVISRNKGGAYILAELDGSLLDRPLAAFRVIPYFARRHIELPALDKLLDVSLERLRALETTSFEATDEYLEEGGDQEPAAQQAEEDED